MTRITELLKQKENGDKVYIFDLRRRRDFAEYHISGTLSLPFEEITSMTTILPNKNARIYLFCETGGHSRSAKTVLGYLGYSRVYDLGAVPLRPE